MLNNKHESREVLMLKGHMSNKLHTIDYTIYIFTIH